MHIISGEESPEERDDEGGEERGTKRIRLARIEKEADYLGIKTNLFKCILI